MARQGWAQLALLLLLLVPDVVESLAWPARRSGWLRQTSAGRMASPLMAKKRRRYENNDDQDFWYSDRDADRLFDKVRAALGTLVYVLMVGGSL
eukprot:scaffold803_cov310-Pinguiococcus_pyrenoidosus.AAC.99